MDTEHERLKRKYEILVSNKNLTRICGGIRGYETFNSSIGRLIRYCKGGGNVNKRKGTGNKSKLQGQINDDIDTED